PGFAFGPADGAGFNTSLAGTELGFERHQAESPWRPAATRHTSAFQPVCAPERVPGGSAGLAETLPEGEGHWVNPSLGEQEPPDSGRRRPSPVSQDTLGRGPLAPIVVTCEVKDAAEELVPMSPSTCPPEGLEDPRNGEGSSSPPMPVINNVFSLAPYQDYLEGTEGSAQVPFCREHLRGDTPPQNLVGSWEPTTLEPGSGGGSPGGAGSEEQPPEHVALDLSLKKRLVKAEETGGPVEHTEGTPAREGAEEENEGPGGKAGVGEGSKPPALPALLKAGSEDKSSFQSSATFM
ncbi:PREDICTED: uncharacterized protein C15orf39 homolog, partial [Tauraco erythrolophus]|uniref:uncharacterized protein C15orf39 homolog n=1 Tax=Tauraco erythrolophus TaxID=121530 RepID=UPI0005235FD3